MGGGVTTLFKGTTYTTSKALTGVECGGPWNVREGYSTRRIHTTRNVLSRFGVPLADGYAAQRKLHPERCWMFVHCKPVCIVEAEEVRSRVFGKEVHYGCNAAIVCLCWSQVSLHDSLDDSFVQAFFELGSLFLPRALTSHCAPVLSQGLQDGFSSRLSATVIDPGKRCFSLPLDPCWWSCLQVTSGRFASFTCT